ncbi:MAG: DHH family phosphoesterase [Candidatus Nanoarchaeia archaeon]|nr:DHH family phosphoesterase [Candidatus Nanoarchaeia archaeon]MDD5741189.1 DHH family phosphoesterase [Candidatus Nanoarchaeia archaeon]
MILKEVERFTKEFLRKIDDKKIHLISHYDTDGITSAAIFSKTLRKLNKQFSIKIIKQLNEEEINLFPEDRTILLLDLGSNNIENLSKLKTNIFVVDHHEIEITEVPENMNIINPHLLKNYEELCTSELVYLISREISKENASLAYLAIIGMVGDTMEKEINKTRDIIIKESTVKVKKGLLLYPSTRPLDKIIEFSSRPFIPGATGNYLGAISLLEEAGIEKIGKCYKSLIDLNDEEMKRLTTVFLLRLSQEDATECIGNLYLVKFFNKIEDARELSAIINACSRMGFPQIAFLFCMGNPYARKKAERIYLKYRQHIISGLRFIDQNDKIEGREYVIINAKDNIKDTLIGTLASILSFSSIYKQGTVIVAMAYNGDKIKVSTRIAGRRTRSNRNLKEIIDSIIKTIGGKSGGHHNAAGCTIKKDDEDKFIELIQRKLEFEVIKV